LVLGGDKVLRSADARLDSIRHAIIAERPDLDPEVAAAIAQIMRTFGSSRTWHRMTAEHGIAPDVAAEASAWAWTTLRDALRRGEGPAGGNTAGG
jgi:hypothetical protein